MVATSATEGKLFIDGNEIGEAVNITWTLDDKDITRRWALDTTNLKSFSCTADIIWKDKIDKALGFTHYAKNGKLFRK